MNERYNWITRVKVIFRRTRGAVRVGDYKLN